DADAGDAVAAHLHVLDAEVGGAGGVAQVDAGHGVRVHAGADEVDVGDAQAAGAARVQPFAGAAGDGGPAGAVGRDGDRVGGVAGVDLQAALEPAAALEAVRVARRVRVDVDARRRPPGGLDRPAVGRVVARRADVVGGRRDQADFQR